jgi:hypothetical protein
MRRLGQCLVRIERHAAHRIDLFLKHLILLSPGVRGTGGRPGTLLNEVCRRVLCRLPEKDETGQRRWPVDLQDAIFFLIDNLSADL